MKKVSFIIFLVFLANLVSAQDFIVKTNGDQIKSKVIEITSETIKYKEFDFQEGPIRNIKINEVFMIIYQNGKKEIYTTLEEKKTEPITLPQPEPVTVNEPDLKIPELYKSNYFMFGMGHGISYGGYGFKAQYRAGGKVGYGFHAGLGYSPSAPILASAGFKFFVYKGLYINEQFGFTGAETSSYFDANSYTGYRYNKRVLYGHSLLVGGDWVWGNKIGFGINAAVGLSVIMNADNRNVRGATDLGFIVRF